MKNLFKFSNNMQNLLHNSYFCTFNLAYFERKYKQKTHPKQIFVYFMSNLKFYLLKSSLALPYSHPLSSLASPPGERVQGSSNF